MNTPQWLRTRVVAVSDEAEGVRCFTLQSVDDTPLPAWTPGAHIEVDAGSGRIRHYSLCGPQIAGAPYRIGVLHQPNGRGGSSFLHNALQTGAELPIRPPKNNFPLVEGASEYVLIAGGIGITPLLSMAERLHRDGAQWELHYGGRSLRSMAFVEQLTDLAPERVTLVPEDDKGILDLSAIMSQRPPGTAVYVCGPPGLISAVRTVARDANLDTPLSETFGPGEQPSTDDESLETFEVVLEKSGKVVQIEDGEGILEKVKQQIPDAMFSCEEGYCGSCEVRVLSGKPVHRDTVIDPEDREESEYMMICVGGSKTPKLVIDL